MAYVNYHKHTHYSNIATLDCVVKPEDYMKRAVELGHTCYVTTEHGWQGNIFEAYTLCQQYGLKCIYGVEAYYVDDMFDKTSRTNYHIVLIALTKNAMKEINKILSKANKEGFYYKPRIDLECLLSLNPNETLVTTACVASRLFKSKVVKNIVGKDEKGEDIVELIEDEKSWLFDFLLPLHKHFGDNLMLEVQNHNQKIQIEHNKKILKVAKKFGIKLIHGNDSHYIYPNDAKYRDMFLKAKGMIYAEEEAFILDYPTEKEVIKRYLEQGVLSNEQITEALKNTLVIENAEPIEIDKEFKIPKVPNEYIKETIPYKNFSNEDSFEILEEIVRNAWGKKKGIVKAKDIPKYEEAIDYELDIIKKCGMADYFILDHIIVNRAVKKYGAVLTRSGRGSGVSFLVNHLLGLTEVDRIKAPIRLYPTRFMSAERILNSRNLPDIDLNFADSTPVVRASKDVLGEDNIYYMVAYKPLQDSSAFRLWCKARNYNINEYNDVAKALAENLTEEEIFNLYPRWKNEILASKVFRGVIESIAPSPCSYLLSNNSISEEIGVIKVGNEYCCVLDGYNCDCYKYLKNDYLVVTIYKIIDRVYKLIGRPIDDISTLINNCDDKVWDLYAKALTTTINQADSDFGKQTVSRYCPKNLAELSAWVASIRPAFASLLNNFLDRKPYTTGVEQLDELLSDSFHYMLYQESIMAFLVWLGVEEKVTYDIIKKISKKKFKEEELVELKENLLKGWVKNVGTEEGFKKTWKVVEDASKYAFNASHSLSVAIDSLYGAYLKSHYPLEYFTVVLSIYADDTVRTSYLIEELKSFDIEIKPIKFKKSYADYAMDKEHNVIYKGISSIKFCTQKMADELSELYDNYYSDFIELLYDLENTSLTSKQIEILIQLNYFSEFGGNKYLLKLYKYFNELSKSKIISKDKCATLNLSEVLVEKYSEKATAKQYRGIDNTGLLKEIAESLDNKEILGVKQQLKVDKEYLGYTDFKNENLPNNLYGVVAFKTYSCETRPYLVLRQLSTGEEIKTRIRRSKVFTDNPFGLYSILKINSFTEVNKVRKVEDEFVQTDETEIILEEYEVITKLKSDENVKERIKRAMKIREEMEKEV